MAACGRSTINRRDALKIGAAAALGGYAAIAAGTPVETPHKPTLNVYSNYAWLRGFSVVPSWGAKIEEAWWNYDGAKFREEVALARTVHANCIRLWIEYPAWMADPDKVTERFLDAVKAIDEHGMKTMPCLFNRWHDWKWDYGGLYNEDFVRHWPPKLEYVRALVTPLASDPRVLLWDLCNEPNAFNTAEDWSRREFDFLKEVAAAARASGAQQPITFGTMYGSNIELYAPLGDVICGHAYSMSQGELKTQIESFLAIAKNSGKVMLVNECMPGCLDDARRAELVKYYSSMLSEAGLGWMGWALREGKAVSTRRDRYDDNGLGGEGFHPFFTSAGKLRPGLDFLLEKPTVLPPWEFASQ
jgi:hypothetical protein